MHVFLAVVAGALLTGAGLLTTCHHHAAAQEHHRPLTVMELYTSQGCSSCPPADRLLGQLAKRDDIAALSMHVSYWDYLGWEDSLAKASHDDRQRFYAAKRGDRQVYTPQLIVNGLAHAVGSRPAEIEQAVARSERVLEGSWVPMSVTTADGEIVVEVGAAPEGGRFRSGTLILVTYSSAVPVTIMRGENRGRTITYSNVARELITFGEWTGEAMTVRLPATALDEPGVNGCMVFLQAEMTGAIFGAAKM